MLAAQLKDHILDSWYVFAPWGVTSRADLEKVTVVVKWWTEDVGAYPQWESSGGMSREILVGFRETALESRRVDDPVLHGLLSD